MAKDRFFGLTTAKTATATNPGGIAGVEFKDEIKAAKREIDELTAAGADVIVAVAHLGGIYHVPCDSSKLAGSHDGRLPGSATSLSTDSHTLEEKTVNGGIHRADGHGLERLGKIILHFDGSGNVTVSGNMLSYDDMLAVTPDAGVTAKIDAVNNSRQELLAKELCQVTNTLWGGYGMELRNRGSWRPIWEIFTADAYRDAAQAFLDTAAGMEAYRSNPVIGMENSGGILASFANGTLTQRRPRECVPLLEYADDEANYSCRLYEILEYRCPRSPGRTAAPACFPGSRAAVSSQVSGIRFYL